MIALFSHFVAFLRKNHFGSHITNSSNVCFSWHVELTCIASCIEKVRVRREHQRDGTGRNGCSQRINTRYEPSLHRTTGRLVVPSPLPWSDMIPSTLIVALFASAVAASPTSHAKTFSVPFKKVIDRNNLRGFVAKDQARARAYAQKHVSKRQSSTPATNTAVSYTASVRWGKSLSA